MWIQQPRLAPNRALHPTRAFPLVRVLGQVCLYFLKKSPRDLRIQPQHLLWHVWWGQGSY